MLHEILKRRPRRPLLIPALVLIAAVNLYSLFRTYPSESLDISCRAYVRHVESRLDGTTELELKTTEYGRILYRGTQDDGLSLGDTLSVTGYLKVYGEPSNPGEFDYGGYLHRRGIAGVLYADSITVLNEAPLAVKTVAGIQKLFDEVRSAALSCFDGEDKALAAAMFTGDTSLVPDDVTRAFKLSNCSHLLAVSGTHFAGFLMILSEVFSAFKVKRRAAAPVYIIFCIAVGTLTGWSESVTRAALMSIVSFMSRDYISGMSLATIILAVKDPYSLMSSGFYMSFAASLSIRLFGPRINALFSKTGMHESLAETITPVIAATLGMMPFWDRTCCYFSGLHLITQISASLLATIGCVFFIPCAITGLPFACSFVLKLLISLMNFTSSYSLGGLSSADLTPSFRYSLFILIALLLMPHGILRHYLIRPSIMACIISLVIMIIGIINAPKLTVVFIDVGQGDSSLIMSGDTSILIDGGVEEQGQYAVAGVLDYYGISKVDLAVATHMDEDHIGGLRYLDTEGRVDTMLTCFDLKAGDSIYVNEDIRLDCLWPYEVTDGGNEDSVVLRLTYGDFSVLYTGDIGFQSEYELIRIGAPVDSDILKVGHHGSAYSTSTEFLEAVSPDISVISVAEYNRYGHPSPDTIARLNDYGCDIRRTDIEGAVIYEL